MENLDKGITPTEESNMSQNCGSFECIESTHKEEPGSESDSNLASANCDQVKVINSACSPPNIIIDNNDLSDSKNFDEQTGPQEALANLEDVLLTKELKSELPSTEDLLEKEASSATSNDQDDILPSLGILPEEEIHTCNVDNTDLLGASSVPISEDPSELSGSKMSNTKTLLPTEISHKEKRIKWKDIEASIITQNNNGPCPLLAILNALILKGKITLPRDRQELTGGELVTIVANAVFDVPRSSVPTEDHRCLEQNSQDAVDILDKLLTGLDVNIKFSGVKDFEFTPELSVFDVLGIPLYHGWVIDPNHEAANLVSDMSYNQLTTNIVSWRYQAIAEKDDSLLVKAMLCEQFIENSVSQLTYQGLYQLGATLVEEEIAVLFRNNHFATIYKKEGILYLLLTDLGYLHTNAVWETLTDVDSTFSEFVNGAFQPIQNCEPSEKEEPTMTTQQQINSDLELATMLQEEDKKTRRREEDGYKMLAELGLKDLSDEELARRLQDRENQLAEEANRALEEEQQLHQQQEASSSPRSSQSSRTSPQHRSSRSSLDHEDKKKKDCTLL